MDDLLKADTSRSETKREQVRNTFTDVVIPIGVQRIPIFVGTCLHEEEDLRVAMVKRERLNKELIRVKLRVINWSDRFFPEYPQAFKK